VAELQALRAALAVYQLAACLTHLADQAVHQLTALAAAVLAPAQVTGMRERPLVAAVAVELAEQLLALPPALPQLPYLLVL